MALQVGTDFEADVLIDSEKMTTKCKGTGCTNGFNGCPRAVIRLLTLDFLCICPFGPTKDRTIQSTETARGLWAPCKAKPQIQLQQNQNSSAKIFVNKIEYLLIYLLLVPTSIHSWVGLTFLFLRLRATISPLLCSVINNIMPGLLVFYNTERISFLFNYNFENLITVAVGSTATEGMLCGRRYC